ncbi:uncharacterized protein BO88DRAFT_231617 [Aspergillus vadensis CBS 113365]|uniref:Secreted protein n=1 Tax=Aspergillus vadensis (strain CBS 113365 / IMI 142717 / IBT 24658) TaxID=1448311 RepID=A0A319BKH8_ASPVC|nr:hypothetical protein BO88DRAFT_231617 [Aspergillus vadensis CBS 113365]PYH71490.1 hypothetical protein BO88DRAFT_231617 [Aspergillus vadensis CBS 113365]
MIKACAYFMLLLSCAADLRAGTADGHSRLHSSRSVGIPRHLGCDCCTYHPRHKLRQWLFNIGRVSIKPNGMKQAEGTRKVHVHLM